MVCRRILLFASLVACTPATPGLQVGSILIPSKALDVAVAEMAQGFPSFGTATLRWHLLEGGYGPAWLLHGRHSKESVQALQESLRWRERLLAGESFHDLAIEQKDYLTDQDPADSPQAPRPFELGGRVAAVVGSMEPQEWRGPLRTLKGWELIFLRNRFNEDRPGDRSRAGVEIIRMTFPVGSTLDQDVAKADWVTLALSGDPQILLGLPTAFRAGRTKTP
ncbi:MAG: hypothetical protein MK213_00595 [Planctomycetes bacterium]|nr:hypothetical protein [Planctomycetota bacterium]